jgi:FkbM family methyltransferase
MTSQPGSFVRSLLDRLMNQHPRFRRVLLNMLVSDRDVDIALCGSNLRINRRKEFGYLRASKLAQSNWILRHEIGVLMSLGFLLEPGDTFLDVGANIGLYTAIFSRAGSVFPQMRFYAFEPNPNTVRRLRQTLASTNVRIFNCALSDREREAEFCEGSGSATFGIRHPDSSNQIRSQSVRLKTVTLDSVPIEGDSIVLKIDVENHEAEVLNGARRLLHSGRVKAVYVDSFADKVIPEMLCSLGFELFEGHTLERKGSASSLLAIHSRHLARWGN